MTMRPPDHETLERVLKDEPNRILNLLPDCTESREAKRLVEIVNDLGSIAREKHKPERSAS